MKLVIPSSVVPLAEAAERLRVPAGWLARRLASPSFFARSAVVRDGDAVVGITPRGLSRLVESKVEQMFTIQESADLLGLHPQTLRRARDAGRLQVIEVLGEERIRESELLRLTTPPVSFSRGRKGAVK